MVLRPTAPPLGKNQTVIWSPQAGPQTALIQCPVEEVFYGGARGGGKTESSIGDWLQHSSLYGEHAVGVFFRRTAKQLEEVIARTQQLFPKLGAKYNAQKSEWKMQNGARLKFRYIERDSDAQNYQGHSYTRVYIEEATNFPSPAPIDLLLGTLRSGSGVPCCMRLTGNPGGPGHHWVKARYITPWPAGYKILVEYVEGLNPGDAKIRRERVFIPSKLSDNPLLLKHDQSYVAKLRKAGSKALVEAWLKGDWDNLDGLFFDCLDTAVPGRHILLSDEWIQRIPRHTCRFRALDWGSARPFSVGWYAVSDGTWGLPDGALFKYREWYGSTGKPNVGLKLDVELVAAGIRERESGERIHFGVGDPSIFVRNGGPSIMERMLVKQVSWKPADNKRVPGWEELRVRFTGGDFAWGSDSAGNPLPGLYFADTCVDSIRTISTLQHDIDGDIEDVDTEQEDHAGDETRYAVTGRPWTLYADPTPSAGFPKRPDEMTILEHVDRQTQKRKQREAEFG